MNGDMAQAAYSCQTRSDPGVKGWPFGWSMRAICVAAYLIISLPALVALCFFTGPFQVPDEATHFFRAVQLSHGEALPTVSADRKWAGGYIDPSAGLWTYELAFKGSEIYGPKHFTVAQVTKPANPDDLGPVVFAAIGQKNSGPLVYAPFNNTVIYFPTAHAVPALVISVARHLNAPVFSWLYGGRLANALTALVVSAIAIFLFEEGSLFALAVCTLPMVLFEEASLSSDALVLAFSVLFAALLARIARGAPLKGWDYAALAVTLIYVCVAKFAYAPLVLAPPMVALIQKRDRAVVIRLAGLALFAIGLWAAWSFVIRNDLLSGRLDRTNVDVRRQMTHVLHQPMNFAAAFLRTLVMDNIHPIGEMVGSKLGAMNLHMPRLLTWLAMANLVLAAVFRPAMAAVKPASRLIIAVLAIGSLLATLLLLYLQYNPVGQPWIDGFQGRYLLPVLALLPLVAGVWPFAARQANRISFAVPLISGVGAAVTVMVVARAYWF
jgi:uncharacterized membrane protein